MTIDKGAMTEELRACSIQPIVSEKDAPGEAISASEMWRESGAIVFVIRRPG